jgi:ATP-dependent Lon protease
LELPVLAIRNTVVFPVLAFPINVGRAKSLAAIKAAMESGHNRLAIVAQKDASIDDPSHDELYQMGASVKILKSVREPGNKRRLIIQGQERVLIRKWADNDEHLAATVEVVQPQSEGGVEVDALTNSLREHAQRIIELSPDMPSEASFLVRSIDNPSILADIVASNLRIGVEEKQQLLETLGVAERMRKVIELIEREIQVLELSSKIQSDVKGEMDKAQREYFLREQLKAIQKELGEVDDRQEEFEELKRGIRRARMPREVEKIALKELKRMSRMSPGAAEYTVSRTYLDWLIELPWSKSTRDSFDLERAQQILDEDHYDLTKVKRRILEYLAVLKLKGDLKGPILCLVGPPGVGKTSLGKSVARALNRKFVRVSLVGVRDEAEIRGHRRTYIGSLPGKVIKSIKKAESNNPVFLLDEVDKMGLDYRGDPASALLEVLDPEQNDTFMDHYLDVPFDLSKVLFICTANQLDPIPGPLRDRMEILELPGYTEEDKRHIARKFLIPENLQLHGLTDEHLSVDDAAITRIVTSYTREAGVRNLKRELAGICRAIAKDVVDGKDEKVEVGFDEVEDILGPVKFFPEVAERTARSGVATGLAWTPVGGDILFVEATAMRGHGKLILTGSLGDVMKESAQAALSFVRARASNLGVDPLVFEEYDIHLHVPSGSIPKDGPSAGVTLMTALSSLFTGRTVDNELAMTGEITLRGHVLPVGGVKEKVLAAARAGIKNVLLPEKNRKDLYEVSEDVKTDLNFEFVSSMEEVLRHALGEDVLKGEVASDMPKPTKAKRTRRKRTTDSAGANA